MAAVLVFEQNILDFLKDLAYEHKNIEIKIEINISYQNFKLLSFTACSLIEPRNYPQSLYLF